MVKTLFILFKASEKNKKPFDILDIKIEPNREIFTNHTHYSMLLFNYL